MSNIEKSMGMVVGVAAQAMALKMLAETAKGISQSTKPKKRCSYCKKPPTKFAFKNNYWMKD